MSDVVLAMERRLLDNLVVKHAKKFKKPTEGKGGPSLNQRQSNRYYSSVSWSKFKCVKENYKKHLEEQKNEGCNVKGFVVVGKAAGNVNIVPGKFILQNARYVVDSELFNQGRSAFNTSHTIHHLSFGDEYPG